jgi:hypothetical protein
VPLTATGPRTSTRRPTALTDASVVLVILLPLLSACGPVGRPAAAVTPAVAATPDVSGTVAAAVQATLQAQPGARGSAPPAGVPQPTILLDESFGTTPQGWPNQPQSTAWYADGAYWLQTREAGHFVALDAPLTDVVKDVVVSARFRKTGGPPGGGYGLVVADQGPGPHDGVNQGGRFVALEAGDQGLIGAWQREEDRWIDLQPWTSSAAVHEGTAVNELTVRAQGQQLTFLVNGTQVAQVTTKLAAGRVGVFVGGDGNQVALERFTVQTAGATALPASQPLASATPAVTPTPDADDLLEQLDAAWTQGRWPEALTLLDQIEQTAPTALDFRDKRYAAHVEAGQLLLSKGNPVAAVDELTKATSIDPSRGEAIAALAALTPTPTPVAPTPRPRVSPEMQAYLVYMYPRVVQIQSGLATIGTQSDRAVANPALIFTDAWRLNTGVALAALKLAGNDIQKYEPVPREFNHLDGLFVDCGKELVLFVNEYAAGVDTLNVARLNSAVAHLESASTRVRQAGAELTNVAQQYDVPLDQSFN